VVQALVAGPAAGSVHFFDVPSPVAAAGPDPDLALRDQSFELAGRAHHRDLLLVVAGLGEHAQVEEAP
jgi:hypothetical protein